LSTTTQPVRKMRQKIKKILLIILFSG